MGEGKKRKRKGKERETRKGRKQVRKRKEAEDPHISYSFITVKNTMTKAMYKKKDLFGLGNRGRKLRAHILNHSM